MIPHHVYYQLAIVGLLWLCVMLHYVWSSRGAVGCIGKKGATYAACFRDLMNDWGMSHFWASADRGVAA